MPTEIQCDYRKVTPSGQANVCRLGRFSGQVTDGMCRRCISDGLNRGGLGDMAAVALSAVGITEERAQAVAQAVGLKDCGCRGRRAWMNRVGERMGLPSGSTASG